jgi:conjugal transfer mating pair stabilization protein TraN
MGRSWHIKLKQLKLIFWISICLLLPVNTHAARFTPAPYCTDSAKICVDSGEKVIDGFKVTKACWRWSYTKTCNFPSKDNCRSYSHCYFVGILPCLLRDNYGTCVNLQKEFSCKSWEPVSLESKKTRYDLVARSGEEAIVCKGIPCLDGNCVDKSYMTDGDMMDSVSKLYAVSKMQPDKNGNFNLFQGTSQHCSKKATQYSNCCKQNSDGWGRNLGAGCTKDEQDLMEKRAKKLCVYVGKESKQTAGMNTIVKHHFCCFGTMLDKVVQVEGRKQLGINFGSGGSPNCRGLTLEEVQRLDFSKMDFSEFIEDFKVKFAGRYKLPNKEQIGAKMQNAASNNMRESDTNPRNKTNNISGWSKSMKPESLEAGVGE